MFKVGDKFSYHNEILTVKMLDGHGWVYPIEQDSSFYQTGFCPVDIKLIESTTIKENPSSITLKQNYELSIQGQTFSLSKSEFEQLKEQVNG